MSIGRPFLNLTSITFNLKFYWVPNPAFAPNCASVNFWVERCGWRDVEWWRLECRREWWVWAGPRAGLGTNSRARSGAGISWADGQSQIRGRDKGRLRDARCADTRSGSGHLTDRKVQSSGNRRWCRLVGGSDQKSENKMIFQKFKEKCDCDDRSNVHR